MSKISKMKIFEKSKFRNFRKNRNFRIFKIWPRFFSIDFFVDRFFCRTFSRVNYFSDLVCFQIKSQHLTPSSNGELSEWSQNSSFFHGKSWKIIKNHQNSPKSMIWGVRSGQKVDFFRIRKKESILFFGTQNLAAANLWMRISRSSEGVGKKNWVSRHGYATSTLT